ncbi:MAG: DUF58 domain-containing protein [Pirellulales bacterium]
MPAKNYLLPEVLEQIKRLEVRARHVVEGFITGQHKSPYHGFAVEFATHREYAPGDDLRHIDWKVWSKTDRLYIKEYEEETNLQCTLIADRSASMSYAGMESGMETSWSKFDYAATVCASLTHLLQHQQDQVGLVTFSDKIDCNLPSASHPAQVKRIVHELESTVPKDGTDLAEVFAGLAAQIRRRGIVVLVSDLFVDPAILGDALQQFHLRGHEVIVMHVMHSDELTFPFTQNILFRGLEIDRQLLTDPRALRKTYLAAVGRFLDQVRTSCASLGVDYVLLDTGKPLDAALASYLAFRRRAARGAARRYAGAR